MFNTIFKFTISYFIIVLTIMVNLNYVRASTQNNLMNQQETLAKFKIENITGIKLENTVLDKLIQETGSTLNELQEKDKKTLLAFSVEYKAEVKLSSNEKAKEQLIKQIGLFRSLDPRVQSYMLQNKANNTIKIKVDVNNPVAIKFIVDTQAINQPALLTDTIDAGWKQ